jgi:hypothetical protein
VREVLAIAGLVAFGLVVLHPVLSARFVLVDDHEILALVAPIGAGTDIRPQLDLRGMAFASDPSVGRFRPLYWTVRFGEIALLGDNASGWHALILALGLVAACLLYAAARALGASRVAAALLGGWLLVAPGVSSLWVRLGADDTLATVFLTLSLLAAARAARGRASIGWDVLLVIAAVAAALTKEAFGLAMVGVALFRAWLSLRRTNLWHPAGVPRAAWLVLAVGLAGTANAFLIGRSAGPLSYGGRYLALPDPVAYLRAVAQNAAILTYVGLGWVALLVLAAYFRRQDERREWRMALIANVPAAALIVPQLLLYSQQGIFEGKYEAVAAVGVAGMSMAGLAWLKLRGQTRLSTIGLSLWTAAVAAFAVSTWTYAGYFTEDSIQLNRMVETVAASTPTAQTIGIAANAARQYEPIMSLVDHIAHQGPTHFEIKVLPLAPDRPYSPLEASFARDLTASALAQPPVSTCSGLGALIVLGDEGATRSALPCLDRGFRRLEFSAAVLLWGGDAVSLRPRLPGIARVSYVVYLSEAAS